MPECNAAHGTAISLAVPKRETPRAVYHHTMASVSPSDIHRGPRSFLWGLMTAAAIGMAGSSFHTLGRQDANLPRTLTVGAVVGACIFLVIFLLERLFKPLLVKVPERFAIFPHIALFLAGGMLGGAVGIVLGSNIVGGSLTFATAFQHGWLRTLMMVSGLIAVTVGLLYRSFAVLHEQLRDREWAEKELEIARALQTRLLPPVLVTTGGLTIASRNLPAHYVAGDFYDVISVGDGSTLIVVADVAGKGVAAALIMASVKAILPFLVGDGIGPAMSILNERLCGELERREFVALALARFDPGTSTLTIANAGLPDPYRITSNEVHPIVVEGERLPLGIKRGVRHQTKSVSLGSRDRVLFLTDGIPEAPTDGGGSPLGYETVAAIVAEIPKTQSVSDSIDAFLANVQRRVEPKLSDDWTAILVERTS